MRRRRFAPISGLRYLVLSLLVAFSLGPLTVFLFSALKTQAELGDNPMGPPTSWQWGNFLQAWTTARMGVGFVNSAIIVVGTVAGVCLIAGCAAYAMARLDLPGAGSVLVYLLVGGSLPIQLFLVPLFFLWTKLHIYDTLLGLIVIYWAIFSPFATLLLRSFMLAIPRDYEEAARIDGAREWTVLVRVVLPLSWPGFLTIALTTALAAYNEFLLAVTFIQSPEYLPVSTGFFSFKEGFSQNYPLIGAAGLLMLAPMLVVFLALQRRFVDGITASGLGGI
ncbi:carbohydrate ABC transporter permease [Tenggerimyces flavus]|uniref:Carbohydrate ABC transporter permease n=1 Tax=Tenggerimyces flavus TaxID=1708749 RepID=A0ABV7Y5G6_9ACTN|nr:carbohydrate ABC transporter permease [Tenggerimyces flavus]MBM7788597.1 raffinose/stachyose/melibiose transport system permease protein [Tenggerimyces flavus]